MDKQLLRALDNLSESLEMIAQVLASKSEEGQSSTTTALQSGDFSKTIEEINVGVKNIKVDTEKILKNQQTIIDLHKKKESDKKTDEFEGASDPKKESAIKKGVGTIMLIALAVLAIGLAFKLVGSVDFLSVIGLSIAILVMSMAFEKVAKLGLSLKEAAITSGVLVMIALAITISSWIMRMITPISITQFLTATFIAITFAAMSKYLENIFIAAFVFDKMKVSPFALIKTLVSISAAITASSWIMQFITPISIGQGMTAVFISLVFSLIGYNLHKIALSVAMFKKIPGVSAKDLILVLVGISAAITVSSWILQLLMPLSFTQLVTAILISAMFLIISFNLEKIAFGVVAFKKTGIKATDLLLVLVGIAAAITVSSWILQLIMPIGLWQFVTALGITILFAIMSYILPEMAVGIAIVGKILGVSNVWLIPVVMIAISLAIMLSSLILQFTAPIPFMLLLKILAISVVLAIATVVVGLAAFILTKVFGLNNIIKGSIAIIVLAFAIKESSLLISEGKYDIYPGWKWTLLSGLAIVGFGLVSWFLNKLGGVTSYIKGGLSILVVSGVIMAASHILNLGKYEKYPTLKWVLGVGAGLAAFGVAAVLLGTQTLNPFFYAGLGITLLVTATILAASHILNLGKYEKYPTLKWVLGVGAALTTFSIAASLLGFQALNPFFYAGLGFTLLVAGTIVGVAKILSKGDYAIPGFASWALSVALLYSIFTPIILILGTVGVAAAALGAIFGDGANPFEKGRTMMNDIAQTIVDVAGILANGKFVGGPKKEWAEGVGIAIGAFAPVYDMLVRSSIFKAFGMSGVGPTEFKEAIEVVVGGIVAAAKSFADADAAFKNPPTEKWAKGVGLAIGAFAPVYEILAANSGWFSSGVSAEDFAGKFDSSGKLIKDGAIQIIAKGIVSAAKYFSKNTAPFEEGKYPSKKWGEGVGAALGAFTPVFKSLSEDTGWFTSGDDVIKGMVNGIVMISEAIVKVARKFARVPEKAWNSYPSKNWVNSLSSVVKKYLGISDLVLSYDNIYSNLKRTRHVAESIVRVAKILYRGRKEFGLIIDPNYMKNMSQNMLDFNELVKKLAESESEGSNLMGGMGKSISSLFGTDPISQIANRMVTLAKGYDAMATALIKLSMAMKMLNVNSVKELGGLTKSLVSKSPEIMGSLKSNFEKSEMNMTRVDVSKKGTGTKPGLQDKNSISYVSKKLEELISIMKNIDKNTDKLDEAMEEITGGKIKAAPDKSEFG